jgi:hypothetical protein
MGRARRHAAWLATKVSASRGRFQSEFIDFERGIRVGHLEPDERITQILKRRLTERHGVDMICDRWGRGVYWQWICWVPEPNRRAKPISSAYNFASSKFFVSVDRDERRFQAGLQIERAPKRASSEGADLLLEPDWDWNVLLRALRPEGTLPRRLGGLLREGFRIRVGAFDSLLEYTRTTWDAAACRRRAATFAPTSWGGFQLFWPIPEREVRSTTGSDLIDAVLAVFEELIPVANACMVAPCLRETNE